MNPDLIDRLKRKLSALVPSLEFGEFLGEGTFSVVYAAKIRNVPCAIKFSKKPWANDPGVQKERQSLLKLMLACNGHPHVATLIDFWDGQEVDHHLVTRWELAEQSLGKRLQQCQNQGLPGIPRDELLAYLQQGAEGLDFVNGQGIVHRDVKPENLLLFQGQVKVVDFGFARLTELDSQTNSVLGTPVYTPPEAFDKRLQPTVDIYCLAGTYVRLRTGQFPFGTGADEIRRRKQAGDFHTQGLEAYEIDALRPALAADSKQRTYATSAALVAALACEPAPPAASPFAPAPKGAAKPSVPPPARRSFKDKILAIVAHDQQTQQEAAAIEAEQAAEQRRRFRQLCEQQFDASEFALCWGTLNWLLRQNPQDAELLELRKFLDAPAPGAAWPRGANSLGAYLTLIPDGEFLMGSPPEETGRNDNERNDNEFQHRVRITQPFYMGIFPVTVAEFKRFVYATGHKTEAEADGKGGYGWAGGKWEQKPEYNWRNPGSEQGDAHPVVNVSWNDTQVFCQWLAKQEGKSYRLPTEAQWEYASRGGAKQYAVFGIGDGKTLISKLANFNGGYPYGCDQKGPYLQRTTPVGSYNVANAFGLYDVHGNVWEWCHDVYDADYYRKSPTDNPKGPDAGSSRVLRGGAWGTVGSACRSAYRCYDDPTIRDDYIGFRLVVSVFPSHPQ